MERKHDFTQEELLLEEFFGKPVGFYEKNPLPKIFEKIKFNANIYELATNSCFEFVAKNWDFYLRFAPKSNSVYVCKMLANIMVYKEMGSGFYVHFMNWICRAWVIQVITGAKIFEIDNNGTDDTILTGHEQDDSNYKKYLTALCSLGNPKPI